MLRNDAYTYPQGSNIRREAMYNKDHIPGENRKIKLEQLISWSKTVQYVV